MQRLLLTTACLVFAGSMAAAQGFNDRIVEDLSAKGFTRIEIKSGPGQTKVEAIRGTDKVEVVYDRATGAILKEDWEPVRAGEDTAPGVEIREAARDFAESRTDRDDKAMRDDDDDRGRGRDDDDGDRHGGGMDDDHDDDDHGGRGGDDDHDDDGHGGRGGDDDHGDDHGDDD